MAKRVLQRAARVASALSILCAVFGVYGSDRAEALPHGCASFTSDASVDLDAFRRRVGTRIYRDEPCTFYFSAGDTYTGNGRFSVACESGGYLLHPDHEEDTPEHSDRLVPIPQPCYPGDLVTVDGFHPFTGGSVVAGGLGALSTPPLRQVVDPLNTAKRAAAPNSDFAELCESGSTPLADVTLTAPVARSGRLTFAGTIECRGASVRIRSLKITGVGGYPESANAGSASCAHCRGPVSVHGQVPARATEYEVEMDFEVSRSQATVRAYRLGRYLVSWAGHVTTLYPLPADDGSLVQ
jgi:hypothetical protein